MDLDLSAPAGRLLSADLVTPPPARGWAAVRRFAGALVRVAADAANPEDAAARQDVVVIRRDTGATVLRVEPDSNADADRALLDHVQDQLNTLTLGDFLDRWAIDPATLSDHT